MKGEKESIKSTFINLPQEKQQRILQAAVQEFAAHGYRKASLNTLVKKLGIAKGSLYRYFANKEALFFFVFANFTVQVKKTVKGVDGGAVDFFGHVENVLRAGILFIDRCPDYYQIYLRVISEQDVPRRRELIGQVRLFSAEYFTPLCAEAKEMGLIRCDMSTEMIVFLIDSVIDCFLQAYASPDAAGGLAMADNINDVIRFLKGGIAVVNMENIDG